jgi:citronellol/citronellal dehydrogenase
MRFSGQRAIVTGASRGIGRALALALAEAGAAVACVARTTDAHPGAIEGTLDATVRSILERGGSAVPVAADLSNEVEAVAAVERAGDALGGLDILVNNAAVAFRGGLDLRRSKWEAMLAVNVRSPWLATLAAAPLMERAGSGRVLNVSSVCADRVFPGVGAYGISKAALERWSMEAAAELASSRVAVNVLRIDVAIRSEGIVASTPQRDFSGWEPVETAADACLWMLDHELAFTGQLVRLDTLLADGSVSARAEGIRSTDVSLRLDGPEPGEPVTHIDWPALRRSHGRTARPRIGQRAIAGHPEALDSARLASGNGGRGAPT